MFRELNEKAITMVEEVRETVNEMTAGKAKGWTNFQ